jgi:hypothetical protein
LPQLRIRQEKHGVLVDVRFGDELVVQCYALVRSKADVEHHRDVTRERRLEDVDGGLLILEEAIDLRLGEELPTVIEVVIHCDLHLRSSRSLTRNEGRFAAAAQ